MFKKIILSAIVGLLLCVSANAQINIKFNDKPLKDAIVEVLDKENTQYSFNTEMYGFVKASFANQKLENILKLLLRNTKYIYRVENNVYIFEKRTLPVMVERNNVSIIPPVEPKQKVFSVIHLNYIDAKALEPLVGPIIFVHQNGRNN